MFDLLDELVKQIPQLKFDENNTCDTGSLDNSDLQEFFNKEEIKGSLEQKKLLESFLNDIKTLEGWNLYKEEAEEGKGKHKSYEKLEP